LHEEQRVKGLSRGERMKLLLALALARRPRLLVLDEPTAGLDPVARHEVLAELMSVVEDERRGILFSSHNTQDVEQTSDRITFIDRGSIIESSDKETFLDRRRRLHLAVPADACLPVLPGVIDLSRTGQLAVATANAYTPEIAAAYERAGATVCDVQRMTLEEIFVATVLLLGIFATAVGVMTERKEKAHLFVLTLPTSPTQYTFAKLAANGIAFFVPWVLLGAAALAVIAATPLPDKLMPFIAALMLYVFCYHSAYLAVALVTDSVVLSTAVIIVGNTAPVFLIPAMFRLLDIGAAAAAAGPVWTPAVLAILAFMAAFGAAVLALAVLIRS